MNPSRTSRFACSGALLALGMFSPWSSAQLTRDAGAPEAHETAAPAVAPPRLGLDQPAPALWISNWIRGEPTPTFSPGTVSVVVFWSTWCQSSRDAVPILNAAQKQFGPKGVRVIAIASADTVGDSLKRVRAFAEQFPVPMAYTVAFDDRRRTVHAWMDAAEENFIPTAFILDREARIAWIGSPVWPPGEFEDVLGQIVAGPFAPPQRDATARKWARLQERLGDLEMQAVQAEGEGNIAQALQVYDQLIDSSPRGASRYGARRFQMLLDRGREKEAYAYGRQLAEGPLRDSQDGLNQVAWGIVDTKNLRERDLELALSAAKRAAELSEGRDAAIQDTLARAYFLSGDRPAAIEHQRRAVELSPETVEQAEYQQRLDEYRSGTATPDEDPK